MTPVLRPMPLTRNPWALSAALLCLILWLVLSVLLPWKFAIQAHEGAERLSAAAGWLAAALVWTLLWSVWHRSQNGEQAVLRYLQPVAWTLLFQATLVEWLLPALWFALAWPGMGWAQWGAQGALLGGLLYHHLRTLWVESSRRMAMGVSTMMGVMCVAVMALSDIAHGASEPEAMPYTPNVQPGGLMLNRGQAVDEGLNRLMLDNP